MSAIVDATFEGIQNLTCKPVQVLSVSFIFTFMCLFYPFCRAANLSYSIIKRFVCLSYKYIVILLMTIISKSFLLCHDSYAHACQISYIPQPSRIFQVYIAYFVNRHYIADNLWLIYVNGWLVANVFHTETSSVLLEEVVFIRLYCVFLLLASSTLE